MPVHVEKDGFALHVLKAGVRHSRQQALLQLVTQDTDPRVSCPAS
jgi:hypothetical protein